MDRKVRVISLVPSWTETLLECGINVIGRTRFCIHPAEEIEHIPVVGGTKEVNWDKVKGLEADFVLLDKEENTIEMAEQCPCPMIVTHVKSIEDVAKELISLSEKLSNEKLFNLAGRWDAIIKTPNFTVRDLNLLPGFVQWVRKPRSKIKDIIYVIWKNPWMSINQETFIYSVLEKIGLKKYMVEFDQKYPEFFLEDYDNEGTLLLLSTEPYPFHKKINDLKSLPFPSMIVDGECFSWFGLRSLKFLEAQSESSKPKDRVFKIRF